jgi:hypothetical protein
VGTEGEVRKRRKEGGRAKRKQRNKEKGEEENGEQAVNLTLKRSDISIRPHKITYKNSRDQRCGYSYAARGLWRNLLTRWSGTEVVVKGQGTGHIPAYWTVCFVPTTELQVFFAQNRGTHKRVVQRENRTRM